MLTSAQLLIKRNRQGHRVIRLHYSADPLKHQGWADQEARKYMGGRADLKWRREMEIDFTAGSGELVFPWFLEREDIFCLNKLPSLEKATFYAGLDWGTRNPISFQVFAVLKSNYDSPSIFINVWELFAQRLLVRELAERIKTCPYYKKLQWIACDPSMFNETVAKKDSFTSITAMLNSEEEVGQFVIDKLMPAHGRSDESGINRIKNLLLGEPCRFYFYKDCVNNIREHRNLKYPERTGNRNTTEKILDKDNHCFDATKYVLLSHPEASIPEQDIPFNTIGYINRMTELAEDAARSSGRSIQEEFNQIYGLRITEKNG